MRKSYTETVAFLKCFLVSGIPLVSSYFQVSEVIISVSVISRYLETKASKI